MTSVRAGRSNFIAGVLVALVGSLMAIVGDRAAFLGDRYADQVRPIGWALILLGAVLLVVGAIQSRRART